MAEGTSPQVNNPVPKPAAGELLNAASSTLEGSQFLVFSPFAERHGSWEITYYQLVQDIQRTVSIALANELSPKINPLMQTWRVEIWIGAEKKERFVRRMTSHFSGEISELNSEPFLTKFQAALKGSVDLVLSLQLQDLVGQYSMPRLEPGSRRRHIDASDQNLSKTIK